LGSETRPFHFIEYDYKNKKINTLFYKLKHTLRDFDFIILDPLIAFYGGDENNNSQAREFMNLLAEWADKENKAILVVHHNNKSTTGGIRGASAFVDAVRLHYELITNENNKEKENTELLPTGYRKIQIKKDNWGVERILKKKEIEIEIFGNEYINSKETQQTKQINKNDNNDKKPITELI
jgi:replicative DNA helicase